MDSRVVLVGPENPLNVGFVARAMKAFGAKDLVIAGSPWKALPAEARVTGVSAPEVLDGVRFAEDLAGALRGCATAIAFSRRPTDLRQDEFTLPGIPASLNLAGRTALVFGRESKGLTRAETALCPYLARIPCQNGVSLNLGQAVAVALFSLTATDRTATDGVSSERAATASLERMTAMWEFVHPKLAASPRLSEERQRRMRQMLFRLHLNDDDFDMLFSIMKGLAK
ncbi:MAG: RNA methyltransferase [Elusimicrobia bacterium]|nr:RNA methyltransferase [Elusimicrobiota bacterium]